MWATQLQVLQLWSSQINVWQAAAACGVQLPEPWCIQLQALQLLTVAYVQALQETCTTQV